MTGVLAGMGRWGDPRILAADCLQLLTNMDLVQVEPLKVIPA